MTVHQARVLVLAAVLVGISALAPNPHLQAQQPVHEYLRDHFDEVRALAEQGVAEAQSALGYAYLEGLGVPQNDAQAAQWYQLAADQGYAAAQFSLGRMYDDGRGVPQDDAEAVRLYRFAADQGHVDAQVNLGVMYDTGEGVPQDYAEAVRWYRLAADQGDAQAQFNLGVMHRDEATRWFRRAAYQGNVTAQGQLGVMYFTGQGVPQDYVQAHMWANLAAAQSSGETRDIYVRGRDLVAALMTPQQLDEAQRRAREWTPTPEP